MAEQQRKEKKEEENQELESLRTEFRTIVGRAIVAGLIRPAGGFDNFLLKGPNYDQDTGSYNQSGGGSHEQNSGDYTQSP
jgi:hypothetical protein